jgi:hypothetical protein
MNMMTCDNNIEILRARASLELQSVLVPSHEPGEVYLAFDQEGSANKVVGVALWKVPKDIAGET